jgi:hypothetical protein
MWAFANEKEHKTIKKAVTNHQETDTEQKMRYVARQWDLVLKETNVNRDVGDVM